MALQHHFIVVIENGKASVDWSMYPNLDEMRTFDTEAGDWFDYDELSPEGLAEAEEAESIIETILEMHNNPRL